MFWSYLKFLITFFFIYYIFYIFLLQNSLCSCLFPPNFRGFYSSPGPQRTEIEVLAPSSSHPAPRGCCWSARHPQLRPPTPEEEEAELRVCGRAMARTLGRQLLAGQPCRHFTAAFFMAFPRKWCDSPQAMNPPSEIQRSNCTALEQPGGIKSSGLFFFPHSKEKIRVHTFTKLTKLLCKYCTLEWVF